MNKLGTSILITCLNEKVGQEVSLMLANSLGHHFANCSELIEYDLFDSELVLEKCGVNYFHERETNVLKSVSCYEDTVIFIKSDLLSNNKSIFKNFHPKVYLKMPRKKLDPKVDVISLLAYEEYDKEFEKFCDIVIEVSNASKSSVVKVIKEFKAKL